MKKSVELTGVSRAAGVALGLLVCCNVAHSVLLERLLAFPQSVRTTIQRSLGKRRIWGKIVAHKSATVLMTLIVARRSVPSC